MADTAYTTKHLSFQDTPAAQERSFVRRVIRDAKNGLTGNWREVVEYFANLWFANRKSRGYLNPPLDAVARKFGRSRKFIQRVVSFMKKDLGLIPVAYEKGGRKATRYVLDLRVLVERLAPSGVTEIAGELKPVKTQAPAETDRENLDKKSDVYQTEHQASPSPSGKRAPLGADKLVAGIRRVLFGEFSPFRRVKIDRSALHNEPPPPPTWCVWPVEVPF